MVAAPAALERAKIDPIRGEVVDGSKHVTLRYVFVLNNAGKESDTLHSSANDEIALGAESSLEIPFELKD